MFLPHALRPQPSAPDRAMQHVGHSTTGTTTTGPPMSDEIRDDLTSSPDPMTTSRGDTQTKLTRRKTDMEERSSACQLLIKDSFEQYWTLCYYI